MNITFLIGNGFDVNLGLKTQYKQFYPIFLNANKDRSPNDCIKKFCDMIEEDYEKWSDFEWAFAQNIKGTHTEVGEILKNFDELFSQYLKEQCEQLVYDSPDVQNKFAEFIVHPYRYLTKADSQKIEDFYNSRMNSTHFYRFINFNYTDTLQKLLNQLHLVQRTTNKGIFIDKKYAPLHIHGSLDEKYMIIGVDSLSQLSDELMKENLRLNRHCVKASINREYGYYSKENEYEQLIKLSDIIYAYGIGFGETDRRRWNVLKDWLQMNAAHKLVIFKYNSGFPELDGMNKGLMLDAIDNAKDEYLKLLGFEEDVFEGKRNQIFVADSGSALQFKLKNDKKKLVMS